MLYCHVNVGVCVCIMKYNFFLYYKGFSVVCNVSSLIIMFKTCKVL